MKKLFIILLLISTQSFAARRWTGGGELVDTNTQTINGLHHHAPEWHFQTFLGARTAGTGSARSGATAWLFQLIGSPSAQSQSFSYAFRDDGNHFVTTPVEDSLVPPVYYRDWRIVSAAAPTTASTVFNLGSTVSGNIVEVRWLTNNRFALFINGTVKDTMNNAMPIGTYFLFKVMTRALPVGNLTTVYVNGETISDTTGYTATLDYFGIGLNAGAGSGVALTIDDAALNDAAGSFENAAPEDSAHVIFLNPVGDQAIGNWVGGGGGTSNLYTAFDIPHKGTAGSETNATNIKNSTSNANDNYDCLLEDYTTAGVPANSGIKVIVPYVRHGEHTATGTENGVILFLSNPPTSDSVTFIFGADVGAHVGDMINTAAMKWRTTWGKPIYGLFAEQLLTRSTQPVVRIGRRTANTNQICVDYVGAMVEYGNTNGWMRQHH